MFARKLFFIAGFLLLVGGLLAGCSSSGEAANEESSEEMKTEETDDQGSEMEDTGDEGSQTDEKNEAETKNTSGKSDHVIDVSAFEMGYDPKELTLNKGEEYELILTNDGEIFHDLTQKEMDVKITYMSEMADHPDSLSFFDKILGVKKAHASGDHDGAHEGDPKKIHMNAKPGQTVRIKFIPKETGEFEFFCSVPAHKEAGMVGKFIVE